jgi:calcineurin-like phosphoesterase family protein
MKTFVTSDLHFGHKNIMKFCPRTRGHYSDTDEMREDMILTWNNIVGMEDLTYILGDVAFLPAVDAVKIMRRLLRDVAEGRNLGDTTTLADASVVNELQRRAIDTPTEE